MRETVLDLGSTSHFTLLLWISEEGKREE